MTLRFSIIIPVYNTEKYLRGTLNSIQNQSYDNFEVIIIDDASTDNSLKIAEEYESSDSRFKVHSIIHSGLSIARNIGITYATGEYTIFVDSDDKISPNLLSEVSMVIDRDANPDLVKFSAKNIPLEYDENYFNRFVAPEFSSKSGLEALEAFLDSGCFYSTAWSYAINTNYLKNNSLKFAPGKIYEDFRFVPEILVRAKTVSSTSFIGYFYIQREESICSNKEPDFEYKKALDFISHYDNLDALIKISDFSKELEIKFREYIRERMIARMKRLSEEHKANYARMLCDRKIFLKSRGLL